MSAINTAINMLPELIRIAEKAWIVAHEGAYAEAWRQQLVNAAVSAMQGVDMVTAIGVVGAVSAALLVPFLTNRRVPAPVHVVLRGLAAKGLVGGVALTFPVSTACFVGTWAFLGLQAMARGMLPWTSRAFFQASTLAIQVRGLHLMVWRDVLMLELDFIRHMVAVMPLPTVLAVLLSWWMSAMVARCVSRAFNCLAHVVCVVLRFVVSCAAAFLVVVAWSMPVRVFRLVASSGRRGVNAAVAVAGAVCNVSLVDAIAEGFGYLKSAASTLADNFNSNDVVALHELVMERLKVHGAKVSDAVDAAQLRANPEPLAEFDFLLTKVVETRRVAPVVAVAPAAAAPRFRLLPLPRALLPARYEFVTAPKGRTGVWVCPRRPAVTDDERRQEKIDLTLFARFRVKVVQRRRSSRLATKDEATRSA